MLLKVRNQSTGAHIYESDPEPTTWNHDLEIGGRIFSFSGGNSEKKLFSAFQNVSNYKKAITTLVTFLHSEIEKIQSKLNSQAVVVNHNFVETCKHIRDPILEILPKLGGTGNHTEKIQRVADQLRISKSEDIAIALLDIDRAITNLQTQISGLQIISGEYTPQPIEHNLRALTDNLLSPFDGSFDKKTIRVHNSIQDQCTVLLDYYLINWAFYHLLNNAVKYCRSNTDFKIKYDVEEKTIAIEMTSIKVEDDEAELIFNPGTRGRNAKNFFTGEGLGMHFVKLSLESMHASVSFVPNNATCVFFEGKPYSKNKIEIRLT